jgi:glyoxylate reductase
MLKRFFVTRNLPEAGLIPLYKHFGKENVKIYAEDMPIPREELLKEVKGVDALLCLLTDKIDSEVMVPPVHS